MDLQTQWHMHTFVPQHREAHVGRGMLSLATRICGCVILENNFVPVRRGGRWDEKIPNLLGKAWASWEVNARDSWLS